MHSFCHIQTVTSHFLKSILLRILPNHCPRCKGQTFPLSDFLRVYQVLVDMLLLNYVCFQGISDAGYHALSRFHICVSQPVYTDSDPARNVPTHFFASKCDQLCLWTLKSDASWSHKSACSSTGSCESILFWTISHYAGKLPPKIGMQMRFSWSSAQGWVQSRQ